MIVAGILLCLICGSASTTGSLYGVETFAGEEWWTQGFFLKFYSPSGKNYFINQGTGDISLESLDSIEESAKEMTSPSPYISFVSLNLKVYDIYFEQQDLQYISHIVEKPVDYQEKFSFIRHSLQSFVGPDKVTYRLHTTQSNSSDIAIKSEKLEKTVDGLQIKTLGPYSKWVHTYSFSENGETATDLTLSPVETSPERSIPLPEMNATLLKDKNSLIASFNTPSGKRYLITNDLNMARDQDEVDMANQSYVMFIEPDGKEYDIHFRKDGSEYVANVVASDNVNEDYGSYNNRRDSVQLLSFVGPDKKTYRIERENGVPILDSSKSLDFRVTFAVNKNFYYKSNVNFIFSNDGKYLNDRVDEYDGTVLAEQPPLITDEVEVNSEVAKSSFLTFYAPSGKIYYLTPNDRSADYAVAKGIRNNSESPYLSFPVQDGRTSHIYYTSSGQTEMKFISPADGNNSSTINSLFAFVTPDKKLHYVLSHVEEDDIRIPYIDMTAQPRDPLDEVQEEALRIVLKNTAREYSYSFTWNGDKLVRASARPLKRVSSNVLKSLIG